jgi:alkylation response protein AidB-like acyl-CoA dehydrogenase
MTEKIGGSDVGQSETAATVNRSTVDDPFPYRLNGFKWFSSATDSNMTLTLAKISQEDGSFDPTAVSPK